MKIAIQLLLKRLLVAVYELLVLVAIWMLVTFLFVAVFGDATHGLKHWGLQLVLWLVAGVYFVRCWTRSGQTLALQAWKMKIVNEDGGLLSMKLALKRYALASALMMAFGATVIWALFDRDRLFLHDRLLHTRCISL
jgi:uncharacterized RDD family membrane protein YckC